MEDYNGTFFGFTISVNVEAFPTQLPVLFGSTEANHKSNGGQRAEWTPAASPVWNPRLSWMRFRRCLGPGGTSS